MKGPRSLVLSRSCSDTVPTSVARILLLDPMTSDDVSQHFKNEITKTLKKLMRRIGLGSSDVSWFGGDRFTSILENALGHSGWLRRVARS